MAHCTKPFDYVAIPRGGNEVWEAQSNYRPVCIFFLTFTDEILNISVGRLYWEAQLRCQCSSGICGNIFLCECRIFVWGRKRKSKTGRHGNLSHDQENQSSVFPIDIISTPDHRLMISHYTRRYVPALLRVKKFHWRSGRFLCFPSSGLLGGSNCVLWK